MNQATARPTRATTQPGAVCGVCGVKLAGHVVGDFCSVHAYTNSQIVATTQHDSQSSTSSHVSVSHEGDQNGLDATAPFQLHMPQPLTLRFVHWAHALVEAGVPGLGDCLRDSVWLCLTSKGLPRYPRMMEAVDKHLRSENLESLITQMIEVHDHDPGWTQFWSDAIREIKNERETAKREGNMPLRGLVDVQMLSNVTGTLITVHWLVPPTAFGGNMMEMLFTDSEFRPQALEDIDVADDACAQSFSFAPLSGEPHGHIQMVYAYNHFQPVLEVRDLAQTSESVVIALRDAWTNAFSDRVQEFERTWSTEPGPIPAPTPPSAPLTKPGLDWVVAALTIRGGLARGTIVPNGGAGHCGYVAHVQKHCLANMLVLMSTNYNGCVAHVQKYCLANPLVLMSTNVKGHASIQVTHADLASLASKSHTQT